MAFIDYYKILEIDKSANSEQIKKAYRKLARKYHPDVNTNDAEAHQKFQQINEANEVLSDPEKRKKYDSYGENWQQADQYENQKQSQDNRSTFSGFNDNFGNDDFSDFFSAMFGNNARNQQKSQFKGQDFNAELQLKLQDILETQKKTLIVNGKKLRITVPAGVEDGQVIKLKGHGAPGANNGAPGDLYLTFKIKEDSDFKRLNNDLYKTVTIDLFTAVLGGEITVETLTGKVKLKIKEGTQNGTKVRLKNKGIPVYKKEQNSGDLLLTFFINIPTNLTAEQKDLFEKLSKL